MTASSILFLRLTLGIKETEDDKFIIFEVNESIMLILNTNDR